MFYYFFVFPEEFHAEIYVRTGNRPVFEIQKNILLRGVSRACARTRTARLRTIRYTWIARTADARVRAYKYRILPRVYVHVHYIHSSFFVASS